MATPIGADHISAIVNRYMMPDIVDLAYDGNPIFFRLYNSNRRFVEGGPHIEQAAMVSKFSAGGSFSDLDVLDMTPQDTLRTVAWDWKEKYVPVAFSNRTMVKLNTADSIANGVEVQVQQAAMTMRDLIGNDLYKLNPGVKDLDSLAQACQDTGAYGGVTRTSGSWFSGKSTTSAGNLTLDALNGWHSEVIYGGRAPTLAVTTRPVYNKVWGLLDAKQSFYTTSERDAQLASAGFTNFLFNGTPFVVDPKLDSAVSGESDDNNLYFLNEDFIKLAVTPLSDFRMEPFQQAYNQAAIAAKLLFTGNLLVTAPKLQHRIVGLTL